MKLAKKLMGCALALVALSMMGCVPNADENDMLDMNAPNGYCTVDYTNETEAIQRSWASLNTKHTSANCEIKIHESSNNAGNLGYLFGLTETKDEAGVKVFNFYALTLRLKNNKIQYYLSYYENISPEYMNKGANNFCGKDGIEAGKTGAVAKETCIWGSKETPWVTENEFTKDSEGFYKGIITVSLDRSNGYIICLYKNSYDKSQTNNNKVKEASKQIHGLNPKEKDINDENNNSNTSEELYLHKSNQGGIAVYGMVQPSATLVGNWTFPKESIVNSLDAE